MEMTGGILDRHSHQCQGEVMPWPWPTSIRCHPLSPDLLGDSARACDRVVTIVEDLNFLVVAAARAIALVQAVAL